MIEYGTLDFLRSITATHAVEGLPQEVYEKYEDQSKAIADNIAPRLARLVAQDLKFRKGDFWHDLAQQINYLVERVEAAEKRNAHDEQTVEV